MVSIAFTPAVVSAVRSLPADSVLLQNLWGELEAIADDLPGRTVFPPPFPHRQDRRLAAFFVSDASGQRWGVSATLSEAGGVVTFHTLHIGPANAYADLADD